MEWLKPPSEIGEILPAELEKNHRKNATPELAISQTNESA